jgi:CBS domain-containing protein
MKIKNIMTTDSVQHCTLETKLVNVAKIMKDANCGVIPVIDKDEKVIGIITDRDICLSLPSRKGKNLADLSIKEILPFGEVHTVKQSAKISDALFEMRKHKVGRLPVTDTAGKLKGIVSINDLLSYSLDRKKNLGSLSAKKENCTKTFKAIFERNSVSKVKAI